MAQRVKVIDNGGGVSFSHIPHQTTRKHLVFLHHNLDVPADGTQTGTNSGVVYLLLNKRRVINPHPYVLPVSLLSIQPSHWQMAQNRR